MENYNCETRFETVSKTMTHVFSERVSVICDFKFGTITTLRDDNPIDKFSIIENKMSIDDYENFLIGIAESAEQLKTL